MNVSHLFVCLRLLIQFLHLKAKGDDHKSIASTLIREAEKNKLSSIERAWVGAAI